MCLPSLGRRASLAGRSIVRAIRCPDTPARLCKKRACNPCGHIAALADRSSAPIVYLGNNSQTASTAHHVGYSRDLCATASAWRSRGARTRRVRRAASARRAHFRRRPVAGAPRLKSRARRIRASADESPRAVCRSTALERQRSGISSRRSGGGLWPHSARQDETPSATTSQAGFRLGAKRQEVVSRALQNLS